MVQEEQVNLLEQNQWEAKPGEELTIPSAYIKDLHYEIIVFTRKERGGSDFTFRCKEYEKAPDGQWLFGGVIIDTSKRNQRGDVELVRLTYHPEVALVNTSFMVVPAPEELSDAD